MLSLSQQLLNEYDQFLYAEEWCSEFAFVNLKMMNY